LSFPRRGDRLAGWTDPAHADSQGQQRTTKSTNDAKRQSIMLNQCRGRRAKRTRRQFAYHLAIFALLAKRPFFTTSSRQARQEREETQPIPISVHPRSSAVSFGLLLCSFALCLWIFDLKRRLVAALPPQTRIVLTFDNPPNVVRLPGGLNDRPESRCRSSWRTGFRRL